MPGQGKITAAQSGAFVELLQIEPAGTGVLDGLRFGVKDLFDMGGYVTGCGNPDWAKTHPSAAVNAVSVDQMLTAGATCIGKTVSDELAFSLDGENFFYGTPLNPRAPNRVPGGSSSGSASAVACGLADFALGTDTGGSVRVPASNCGIFGLRPSHGLISIAGVLPFAPTFDTVGVLAKNVEVLTKVATTLLTAEIPAENPVGAIHVLREAWDLCDLEVSQALAEPLGLVSKLFGEKVRETSIREIDGAAPDSGLTTWYETLCALQRAEIWSCLGSWVQAVQPAFGLRTKNNFEKSRTLDRRKIGPANRRREDYYRRLQAFLGPLDLLVLPTTPALAPIKGTLGADVRTYESAATYYPRALSLTAIAGLGRLPQVTLPLGDVGGVPVGLSLLAGYGRDAFLLGAANQVADAAE